MSKLNSSGVASGFKGFKRPQSQQEKNSSKKAGSEPAKPAHESPKAAQPVEHKPEVKEAHHESPNAK